MATEAREPQPILLTPQELADQLGESVDELAALRRQGKGPDFIAISERTVRYLVDDVDEWLIQEGLRHRKTA